MIHIPENLQIRLLTNLFEIITNEDIYESSDINDYQTIKDILNEMDTPDSRAYTLKLNRKPITVADVYNMLLKFGPKIIRKKVKKEITRYMREMKGLHASMVNYKRKYMHRLRKRKIITINSGPYYFNNSWCRDKEYLIIISILCTFLRK